MWPGQLGEIKITDMRTFLIPDDKPFMFPPYRTSPKTRELQQDEIDKQLKVVVTKPSIWKRAPPVLFVPMKDGNLRFCIYYWILNTMNVKDTYHLPWIDDCIDKLSDNQYFTILKFFSGTGRWTSAKRKGQKTTFVCHARTFRWVRIPFGLNDVPQFPNRNRPCT